jgi:hypothetical protein
MDIALYIKTLWRYRPMLIYGIFVALLLAALSAFKVTSHGVEQRGSDTYSSTATLLITRADDFPYGRTAPSYLPSVPRKGIPSVQVGDPNQLTSFGLLYAELANSDQVKQVMREKGPLHGVLTAKPVFESPTSALNGSSYLLPLVTLTGTSTTARLAVETAQRGTEAFLTYLKQQQNTANIPANQRVSVQVLRRANGAARVSAPSLTIPIVVFLAVMIAVIALAFTLENVRSRPAERATRAEDGSPMPVAEPRLLVEKPELRRR